MWLVCRVNNPEYCTAKCLFVAICSRLLTAEWAMIPLYLALDQEEHLTVPLYNSTFDENEMFISKYSLLIRYYNAY